MVPPSVFLVGSSSVVSLNSSGMNEYTIILAVLFAEVMDHIPLTQQSQPFLRDLSTFPDAIQKDMLILSMFWGNPLFC